MLRALPCSGVLLLLLLQASMVAAHWVQPVYQRKRFCNNAEITCMLFPDLTEGPYYINDGLVRKDITEGKDGLPLRLVISVVDATTCNVAVNAAVDVWHCDALGIYSHFVEQSQGDPNAPIDNTTFLRGIQLTDSAGSVTFDTIYPGWYVGRVTHMHVKVHFGGNITWGSNSTGKYVGGSNAFTGQLFFSDELTDTIAERLPYRMNEGERTTLEEDGIYMDGGSYGMTTVQFVDPAVGIDSGLIAYITLGVDPEAEPQPTTTRPPSPPTRAPETAAVADAHPAAQDDKHPPKDHGSAFKLKHT